MTSTQKAILTAAIVGGVCGIAGAAFYVAWRARQKGGEERVSSVVRQLEKVADRIQGGLMFGGRHGMTDARGIVVNTPQSS